MHTSFNQVVAATGVKERALRRWFSRRLITSSGIRNQIVYEPGQRDGVPLDAVEALVDRYLVRKEERSGIVWYELAHDRLVEPVLASNRRWYHEEAPRLLRQYDVWEAQDRPAYLLLQGADLAQAERWIDAHPDELTEAERDFVARSRDGRRVYRLRRGPGDGLR